MKIKKNTWFCEKNQTIQINWYKFFVQKKQVPLEILIDCIKEVQAEKKSKHRLTLGHIQEYYFQDLINKVTDKTGLEFKKRPERKGYQEWYDRACMDGSLAFNGVADSF